MEKANLRMTKFYRGLDNYKAISIAEGFDGEEHTQTEELCAWQFIADKGLWKGLQGWFGRTVESLIEQGLIRKSK